MIFSALSLWLCGSVALWFCGKFLEAELQRKLNLPRRRRAAHLTKAGAGECRIRRAKIGLIEEVEKLRAEFQLRGFVDERQREVLLQSEIELVEGIAASDVPSGVTKGLIDA